MSAISSVAELVFQAASRYYSVDLNFRREDMLQICAVNRSEHTSADINILKKLLHDPSYRLRHHTF